MAPEDIRRYRADLGMTQAQLAAVIDVDPVTISRWERGTRAPPMPTVLRLALDHLVHTRRRRPARKEVRP